MPGLIAPLTGLLGLAAGRELVPLAGSSSSTMPHPDVVEESLLHTPSFCLGWLGDMWFAMFWSPAVSPFDLCYQYVWMCLCAWPTVSKLEALVLPFWC